MSSTGLPILERLVRTNGLGPLIDMDPPAERALGALLERLESVESEYYSRVGARVSFSPESLEAEALENPHKVQAFLQACSTTRSPAMLVMVWRILEGLSIQKVAVHYQEQTEFSLKVNLTRSSGSEEATEEFESRDISDASLMRHFGIASVRGMPLFVGFYPLRLEDKAHSGA